MCKRVFVNCRLPSIEQRISSKCRVYVHTPLAQAKSFTGVIKVLCESSDSRRQETDLPPPRYGPLPKLRLRASGMAPMEEAYLPGRAGAQRTEDEHSV
jgi:hypothetical protein